MESLVIGLREGVEAALILGIIVAYLRRTGRPHLMGAVWGGLGVAALASVAAAFVLPALFRSVLNEEIYEGVLMLAAGLLILSLVIWMAAVGRKLGRRIEEKVERISTSPLAGAGVFLFTFIMIFREGAEVVLLLSVLSPGTDAVVQILGGLVGIALAVLFGIGFVKGTARIDLGRFFRVTGAMLGVLAFLLLVGGLHEFGEAEVIPVGPREMALIGPIVNNNTYVFSGILIVTASLVLLGGKGRPREESLQGSDAVPGVAAERKRNWLLRMERRWRLVIGVQAGAFVLLLGTYQVFTQAPQMEAAQPILDNGGKIRIPLADLEDGQLRFYEHERAGETIRFFGMRVEADRYEICLDACLICGPLGYYQRGPELICRNCVAPINLASVGQAGGCNPIPVASKIQGGEIVITTEALHSR